MDGWIEMDEWMIKRWMMDEWNYRWMGRKIDG